MEHLAILEPALTTPRRRDRTYRRPTSTLGDAELLAQLLGASARDAPALALVTKLMKATGGVAYLSRASPRELAQLGGLGASRAARVAAAFELGRRALEAAHPRASVGQPEDIFRLIAPRVAGLSQEAFFVIGVDIRNGLLDVVEVARGSVMGVEVHPREVFRPLIRMAAAGGVLAHNHPSGDPRPSDEDIALTQRLREIGMLLGLPIIDHVVVGHNSFRSLVEWLGPDLDR